MAANDDPLVEVIRVTDAQGIAESMALLRRAGIAAVPDIDLGPPARLAVLVPQSELPVAEAVLDAILHVPEGDATLEEIERDLSEHAAEKERRERVAGAPDILRREVSWSWPKALLVLASAVVLAEVVRTLLRLL